MHIYIWYMIYGITSCTVNDCKSAKNTMFMVNQRLGILLFMNFSLPRAPPYLIIYQIISININLIPMSLLLRISWSHRNLSDLISSLMHHTAVTVLCADESHNCWAPGFTAGSHWESSTIVWTTYGRSQDVISKTSDMHFNSFKFMTRVRCNGFRSSQELRLCQVAS